MTENPKVDTNAVEIMARFSKEDQKILSKAPLAAVHASRKEARRIARQHRKKGNINHG